MIYVRGGQLFYFVGHIIATTGSITFNATSIWYYRLTLKLGVIGRSYSIKHLQ